MPSGGSAPRPSNGFLVSVGAIMVLAIMALALYLPGMLKAQGGERGYFNAPALDPSSYEIIVLEPGMMICNRQGAEIWCSPALPNGTLLFIPKKPALARPDST